MTTIRIIKEMMISGSALWIAVSVTSYLTGLGVEGASILVAASVIVWVIWKEKK